MDRSEWGRTRAKERERKKSAIGHGRILFYIFIVRVGRRLIGDVVRYFCNFGEFIVHTAGPRPLTRIINVGPGFLQPLRSRFFLLYKYRVCYNGHISLLFLFSPRRDGLHVAHFSSCCASPCRCYEPPLTKTLHQQIYKRTLLINYVPIRLVKTNFIVTTLNLFLYSMLPKLVYINAHKFSASKIRCWFVSQHFVLLSTFSLD